MNILFVLAAIVFCAASHAKTQKMQRPASNDIIEILILDIKPGKRDEFHNIYEKESLPLLRKWNIKVTSYGPSLHDENSYYIIRSFKSLEERQKSEDAFYSSDDWKNGPRTSLLALVGHFAYTVLPVDTWKDIAKELEHN
jgi:hypothetical protein